MSSPTDHGPRYRQLPLWRDATRLLLEVENAVRQFGKTPSPPRYHKYALGSDLRRRLVALWPLKPFANLPGHALASAKSIQENLL